MGLAARRDRLAVVLKRKVHLFALPLRPGQPILPEGSYHTADNPLGLGCVASTPHSSLLVFPARQPGHLAIVKLPPLTTDPNQRDRQPKSPFPATSIIIAHQSALTALSITPDGRCIATASSKGTLVRVFDGHSTKLIKELRRGADPARIFSLAFKPDGTGLACASDKGTVHIFFLDGTSPSPASTGSGSRRTSLDRDGTDSLASELKPFLPKYFSSTWSDAQFRLPPPEPQSARTVPFLGDLMAEEKPEKPLTTEDDPVLCSWAYDHELQDWVLCAITQSGGWFKLAMLSEAEYVQVKEARAQTAATQRKGKSSPRTQSASSECSTRRPDEAAQGAHGRCRLVQYSRYEQRDGW